MAADERDGYALDGSMSCGELANLLARDYAWALAIDPADERERARFWYVSEEKLEPRLGLRANKPGAERELPLTFAYDVVRLAMPWRARLLICLLRILSCGRLNGGM